MIEGPNDEKLLTNQNLKSEFVLHKTEVIINRKRIIVAKQSFAVQFAQMNKIFCFIFSFFFQN